MGNNVLSTREVHVCVQIKEQNLLILGKTVADFLHHADVKILILDNTKKVFIPELTPSPYILTNHNRLSKCSVFSTFLGTRCIAFIRR